MENKLSEMIENIEKSGFYIWRNLLSSKEVQELQEAADEIVSRQEDKYCSERYVHKLHPKFLKFVVHPIIIKGVKRILGTDNISFLEDILFFKPPGANGVAAHQENFYLKCKTIHVYIIYK